MREPVEQPAERAGGVPDGAVGDAAAPVSEHDETTNAPGPLMRWVIEHDQRWSFLIAYIALAIGLTVWLGLFWLLVVVAGHFALEVARKRQLGYRGWAPVTAWSLWSMKFDLALVIWAMALVTYTSITFGMAGLSSLSRASLLGVRLKYLTHVSRLVPIPVREAALASRIVIVRKMDRSAKVRQARFMPAESDGWNKQADDGPRYPWQQRWTLGDKVSTAIAIICLASILIAPTMADESLRDIGLILLDAFDPRGPSID